MLTKPSRFLKIMWLPESNILDKKAPVDCNNWHVGTRYSAKAESLKRAAAQ